MTRQIINRGSFPGDASGEILYDAFGKVNANSAELYAGVIDVVRDHGAVGDGSTDNKAAIQAAIDAANIAGGGDVYVPPGDYLVSSKITVKSDADLHMANGARIYTETDHDLIEIKPRARVFGGAFEIDINPSTSAVILFDGSTDVFRFEDTVKAGIHNAMLNNNAAGEGYGIKYTVTGTAAGARYISATDCSNIQINQVLNGIYMYCEEDTGDAVAFINGNTLRGVTMKNFHYGFQGEFAGAQTPSIAGNIFSDFVLQITAASLRVLKTAAGSLCSKNRFTNWIVWDWSASSETTAIEWANTSTVIASANFFSGNGIAEDEISPKLLTAYTDISDVPDVRSQRRMDKTPQSVSTTTKNITSQMVFKNLHLDNVGAVANGTWTLLTDANAKGAEVVVERDNAVRSVTVVFEAGDIIYDPVTDTTSAAGEAILLGTDNIYIHLRAYRDGVWHIVATNGVAGTDFTFV